MTQPTLFIFDIDGVLADNSHRNHLIKPHDQMTHEEWLAWSAECPQDRPILPMIRLLEAVFLDDCTRWEIWTARGPEAKEATLAWLAQHTCIPIDNLASRLKIREKNLLHGYVSAVDLKRGWIKETKKLLPNYQIVVFEDTIPVVDMFLGEKCIVNIVVGATK